MQLLLKGQILLNFKNSLKRLFICNFLKIFISSGHFIKQLLTNFIQFRPFHQSHENDILIRGGRWKIILLILSCKKVVEAREIKK